MKTLVVIVMVAIVLEALVEYIKTFIKMVEEGDYKTAITQGATVFLGIGLAFLFHVHLFDDVLSEFYEGLYIDPTADTILTGILFSRGSNYFSDLVAKLTPKFIKDEEFAPNITIKTGDGSDMEEFLNGGE